MQGEVFFIIVIVFIQLNFQKKLDGICGLRGTRGTSQKKANP
jgi:hypothetical protein